MTKHQSSTTKRPNDWRSAIGHWRFSGFSSLVIGVFALASMTFAQDRVTVTRDENTLTLSNPYLRVTISPKTASIEQIRFVTAAGDAVTVMDQRGRFSPYVSPVGPGIEFYGSTVIEHYDGSVTVAMLSGDRPARRVATCITMLSDVACITWTGREENLTDRARPSDLNWTFEQPHDGGVVPAQQQTGGWYWPKPDVNLVLVGDSMLHGPSLNRQGKRWQLGATRISQPSYTARSGRVTIAVASGIGPISAASDMGAVSEMKNADGQWQIAVAPFGRLINSQLEATAGTKLYQQTVNAGPREPFVVATPLNSDKITVTWRDAQKRVLLQTALQNDGQTPEKIDADAISKQRVQRLGEALKAMEDGRWSDAMTLSKQDDGDGLWMKLIGVLAEQQAANPSAAESALRQIVARDPAAAEAWLLLGEKDRAAQLGDVRRMQATIDSLRSGHVPGKE